VATNFLFTLTARANFWTKSPEMIFGAKASRRAVLFIAVMRFAGFSGHFVPKFAPATNPASGPSDVLSKTLVWRHHIEPQSGAFMQRPNATAPWYR
jgi:hypothetical protein